MKKAPRSATFRSSAISTQDGFVNFQAKLGLGAQNLSSASQYDFNFITRNRQLLEAMYRGSWLVGMAVDAPAEDMTRAGISITSTMEPDDIERLTAALLERGIWEGLTHAARWGRLFGGGLAVMLIEGADMSQPLRTDAIARGSFKGLLVLDRWMVQPSVNNLVEDFGPNLGKPKYYEVVADAPALPRQRIHYSRVVRFDGIDLPYFQRLGENHWSESVVERIYDRLTAFDSTTLGAAQLVYRAHLRTMKVKDYRQIVAQGGPALRGLTAQMENMRMFQSNEGVTLMDADDAFEAHSYSFGGLSDVLMQFGEQVSGAVEVPLVRLFGQSPAGLSSSGESDLRTYYDGINKKQETRLRTPVRLILEVLCRSELDMEPPPGFNFVFNPLWLTSDQERATIGQTQTATVQAAYEAGMVKLDTALRELKQGSRASGMWTNITEEEIDDAKDAPPPSAEAASISESTAGGPGSEGGAPDASEDMVRKMAAMKRGLATDKAGVLRRVNFQGLPCVVEIAKGEVRKGGSGTHAWEVIMPADYGYIEGVPSAEGVMEELDCFIGPDVKADAVYVINQYVARGPRAGAFDEHKVMLGFPSAGAAVQCYKAAFSDGMGADRIGSVVALSMPRLKQWIKDGDLTSPLSNLQAAE